MVFPTKVRNNNKKTNKSYLEKYNAHGHSNCHIYIIFTIFDCLVYCRAYIFHGRISKNCIDAVKPLAIISMVKHLQIIHHRCSETDMVPTMPVEDSSFVNKARGHDTFEAEPFSTYECCTEAGPSPQRLRECQRQNTNAWFPKTFKTTRQAY